ncbi:Striatin-interacting protein 1 [Nymphon striatum]|nr:Striatin-interacting protein 1 [Nymphon striatum]
MKKIKTIMKYSNFLKFNGNMSDMPDLDFIYGDTDSHTSEIAELYSYTEEQEFQLNYQSFEELMAEQGNIVPWTQMTDEQHHSVILRLSDLVEVSQRTIRMKACRACLYLVQGVFNELTLIAENINDDDELVKLQKFWSRKNVFNFYAHNMFTIFVELLNLEIDNNLAATSAQRKPAVSLGDSVDLRVILSVLYTMVEIMRHIDESDSEEWQKLRSIFVNELGLPVFGEELLATILFGMVTRFCSGNAPHFPMKKVLLLLWKTILLSLGGIIELKFLKSKYREEAGLLPVKEDTIEVSRSMRAASPPASAADLIEAQQQKRGLMKQTSMDDSAMTFQDLMESENGNGDEEIRDIDIQRMMDDPNNDADPEDEDPSPRPSTPIPGGSTETNSDMYIKGLPWTPKVRYKDIDNFLDNTRMKFVGFNVPSDRTSLAGLPQPIHEGLHVLNQHIYESLSEVQIKREEEISKNPVSKHEKEVEETPTEILYSIMLPHLPQYMISLLKILLAAAPTSKTKSDSINVMADVLPEEMPKEKTLTTDYIKIGPQIKKLKRLLMHMTVTQSMKLGIDVNRHKEIIVKSVSGILLLLLKHFKINHVYQFEFMSQQLMFANCIPLVLKFFNQNIMSYVSAKNSSLDIIHQGLLILSDFRIAIIDFPMCVLGEQPELTSDTLELGDNQMYCCRNMFSCINLLRVLNKLTKWKHSRIMMLVVFKSAPILKRTLKVKHAMMQLYVLKLLKMQTKYLGRQWRKSNMKTMSAIYQKVRHRLNDDWAYGNADMDARPWDFQAEEFSLQSAINHFHSRRYDQSKAASYPGEILISDPDYQPVDNNLQSVLGQNVELTDEFKIHYEKWVQQEVFNLDIDWDVLLTKNFL